MASYVIIKTIKTEKGDRHSVVPEIYNRRATAVTQAHFLAKQNTGIFSVALLSFWDMVAIGPQAHNT